MRSNLSADDPAQLWKLYTQLTEIEEAFKNIKGDLSLRPNFHQREDRVEAQIFISFVAYCLHVTLRRRLTDLAPGLTPRSVLEKMATTDDKTIVLTRYTQPSKEVKLLLEQLRLTLPAQPPPKIKSPMPIQKK